MGLVSQFCCNTNCTKRCILQYACLKNMTRNFCCVIDAKYNVGVDATFSDVICRACCNIVLIIYNFFQLRKGILHTVVADECFT